MISMSNRIEGLLAQGLLPICRTLETHDDKTTAIARERYWVEVYRQQGMPLDNSMYPSPKKIAKKASKKISPLSLYTNR